MIKRLPVGIHMNVPEAVYHADPCDYPSLSSGIGRLLLRSPMHARHAHPRLNLDREERAPTTAMEEGTVLHRLILGAGSDYRVIEADDWRGKAAREARDEARASGAVPILAQRFAELEDCADAAREQVGQHCGAPDALRDGDAEVSMVWRDGNALCRGRVDWLKRDPHAPLVDLKTTGLSADPSEWERKLVNDYAFQAAFYCRGIERLRGVRPAGMLFVVVETEAPYAVSIVTPAPSLMALADRQVDEAISTWARCQRTGLWPGYPPYVAHVEAPGWKLAQIEERALRADLIREHEMEAAQ